MPLVLCRDKGIPLWWIFAKVDKRTRTPLCTVWLAVTCAFLLGKSSAAGWGMQQTRTCTQV